MQDKTEHSKHTDARKAALFLLGEVLGEARLMSEILAGDALARYAPPDRARAQRLANETLRWLERADRLLDKHLRKAPPLFVRNALRLGTVELCQGEAAHGVVDSYVRLVGQHKRHGALKGLVNAVLRKIAKEGPEAWDILRIPRLPKWLRAPLQEAWGPEAMRAMEAAHAAGAPLDLTLKSADQDLATTLGGEVLPTGSLRLSNPGQVSELPGYAEGEWWVQDAAAALPVLALDPQPGARVLDLCAAPGGKTLQLAASGANVTAVDVSPHRMARVEQNLQRTGLRAETRVADAFDIAGQWEAVLLDAPCSATGTLRRHPDLPYAKDGSEFSTLIAQQEAMIDHAWNLVKPGGHLLFCTCSLLPDEGEVQVDEALARHANMEALPIALQGLDPGWNTPLGLRLRPDYWADRGGMDGFFIAKLLKTA